MIEKLVLNEEPEDLRAEVQRLQAQVADLQSGMYVNCVYCGHRYGRQGHVPESMADVLKAHIAQCPKHPMSKLLKGCKLAFHTLSSLRAVRDGIPDERLDEYVAFLREALASAEVAGGGS